MGALIGFYLFFITIVGARSEEIIEKKEEIIEKIVPTTVCPFYKNGPSLEPSSLVGSWMTVYTQPKSVKCFNLHIRSVTDLEREQCMVKYGNFSDRVNWTACYLEVVSPQGKHYLQGDGTTSGLLENIIIVESGEGNYTLQDQTADQWTLYGRRGSELLLMRDCAGEIAAMFARIPYWPTPGELYAVLHRSGVAASAQITDGKEERVTDIIGDQKLSEEDTSMEDYQVNGRKPL